MKTDQLCISNLTLRVRFTTAQAPDRVIAGHGKEARSSG